MEDATSITEAGQNIMNQLQEIYDSFSGESLTQDELMQSSQFVRHAIYELDFLSRFTKEDIGDVPDRYVDASGVPKWSKLFICANQYQTLLLALSSSGAGIGFESTLIAISNAMTHQALETPIDEMITHSIVDEMVEKVPDNLIGELESALEDLD